MRTIRIKGLDCSACAAELEELLGKIAGVREASVSFVSQTVMLDCDENAYEEALRVISNFEEVEVVEEKIVSAKIEQIILLKNLDCSACAAELESIIRKIEGVEEVSVSFVNQKITLVCSEEAYRKAVDEASNFEEVEVVTDQKAEKKPSSAWKEHKTMIVRVALSVAFFLAAFLLEKLVVERVDWIKWIVYLAYAVSFFSVGYSVLAVTAKNLVKGKIFDENFLMTIGALGAIALGDYSEGVAVMLLYQIGELLQAIAVGSSRRSISDLMELKSETANLLTETGIMTVTPESLRVGDTIVVKVGEKFPVDAVITKGETSVDTKSLSGEAMLRDVREGSELLAGSINASGVVEARVVRVYADSAVAKILEMVENSSSKKARPEKFITKFARVYTPVVFFVALALAFAVPTVFGLVEGFAWATYEAWMMRALKVLVISCPCALIISVPLSYFGGIGACASNGILVKGATYLDTLADADIAIFDKTGTLTEGTFYVSKVNGDETVVLPLAAALEHASNHPVAVPFREIETPFQAEKVKEVAGKGIVGEVNGETILCGNEKLMAEYGISYQKCESLSTVLYVARGDEFLGSVEIEDKIKEETVPCLEKLKALGIQKTVMLTGDNRERAMAIAERIGIDEVRAGLLPDEKLSIARELKEEGKIIYTGDGINDAPVMAESDVSVSMGKIGSDAAIEASDLVLVSDSLLAIPKAIRLAKRTKFIVVYNIAFSLAVKLVLMGLGIFVPALPLWCAVLGDVGVMLIAVLNSLFTRCKVR